MSEGSLIVIKKNGSEGSKFPMHRENLYKLGPGVDCHLRFNIDNYTDNVCCISTSKKGLATISKISSCPVLINNVEINSPKSLKYGDLIRIGTKTFKWSTLTNRESFTRNVFKNHFKDEQGSDARSSPRKNIKQLCTLQETNENLHTVSTKHKRNSTSSPMRPNNSDISNRISSSTKSKTVPKNHGSATNTPRGSAKSLKFEAKSEKKSSPIKKKYFDENNRGKPSKIPRKFFPDLPKASKVTNVKTPVSEKRKSIRSSKQTVSPDATEIKVRTPDCVGFKPITPNIKLIKSVTKKNASLKKSLDKKNLAKKRKISNVADEEFVENKKFKFSNDSALESNEQSLLEDETMGSLFNSSLLETTNYSPLRSKNSKILNVSTPNSPQHNISGIKSIFRTPVTPKIKASPKSTKSSGKSRKSSNLISFDSPDIKNSKSIFSTPNAQSTVLNVSLEEKTKSKTPASTRKSFRNSIKTPISTGKDKSLPRRTISPKSPASPRKSITSPINKKLLQTPGQSPISRTTPLSSGKNEKLILTSSISSKSPTSTHKSITSPINTSTIKKLVKTPGQSPKSTTTPLSSEKGNRSISSKRPTSIDASIIKKLLKTPGRSPKSTKKNLAISSGVQKLLKTPQKSPKNNLTPGRKMKSPKNDLTNIVGMKKLLKTPRKTPQKSPKNDLTDLKGVKTLLKTPGRTPKSPKNDLTNIVGVKKLLKTPRHTPQKSPKNDLTDIKGVKTLLKTPGRKPKSPRNDLTNIAGVKKLLTTPRRSPKSPKNDLTDIKGVKTLLKTPGRKPKSPRNDLTNVAGVKKLLATPRRSPKSPKNDLTDVKGVKHLLDTPGRKQKSPKNDLTNVAGVKKLLATPRRTPKSPKNDLTNIIGIKKLLKSPTEKQKSPKNDLTNVSGVRNLLRSPMKSPKNDLTNVSGVKEIFKSKSPKNDLKNISGVGELFATPENKKKIIVSPNNSRLTSYDKNTIFDELKEGKKENLILSFSPKSPIRTYERRGKSLSPIKSTKISDNRLSLFTYANNENSEQNVQKWLNEHVLSNVQKESEIQSTPEPVKGRRGRKKITETDNKKPTTRGRKKNEDSEEIIVVSPPKRSGRKRAQNELNTSDNPTKPTKKIKKQVQFDVSKSESPEIKTRGKRTNRAVSEVSPKSKKLKLQENTVVSSPVRTTRRNKNNADVQEQPKQTEDKPVSGRRGRKMKTEEPGEIKPETENIQEQLDDNKPTGRGRRGRRNEVEKIKTVTENFEEQPKQEENNKPTGRGRRGRKIDTENLVVEEPEEKITSTRSRRGKKTDDVDVPTEEKTNSTRSRKGKKENVEEVTEETITKRGRKRNKVEENVEDEKEPKTRTRSTRAKKNETIIPEVRSSTRSRRK